MLAELNREYGMPRSTRVIHNARQPGLFPPGPKEPLIFTAGRLWDDAKNIATLEQAGKLPWPIFAAGAAGSPDGHARRPGRLNTLGPLSSRELASWLASASIYALPARYEPFGLSALEAALAGCALVLGDIPSLREIWGDAALYVPPDDPAAWRETLCRLIHSSELRGAMAAKARQCALLYSPDRMARAYLSAYDVLETALAARGTL
jgi:glycosyltransferase involved in cell wall biosynthesis